MMKYMIYFVRIIFLLFVSTWSFLDAKEISSEIWIVIGQNVIVSNDNNNSTNSSIMKLIQGSFVIGQKGVANSDKVTIKVLFPTSGYITLSNDGIDNQIKIIQNNERKDENQIHYMADGILAKFGEDMQWTAQWPIGTGKLGALIGGSFSRELIPLSIADLYVKKRVDQRMTDKPKTSFIRARSEMIKGNLEQAHKSISGTEVSVADSHFEYVADLTFCYATSPFKKSNVPNRDMDPETPDRDLRSQPINALESLFTSCGPKIEKNKIHYSSFLDFLHGITKTFIIVDERILYERKWFASAHRDVMINSITCMDKSNLSNNCINTAMRLSRQSGWHKPTSNTRKKKMKQLLENTSVFGIEMEISPSKDAITPHVHVCLAFICYFDPTSSSSASSSNRKESDWANQFKDIFVCNNGYQLDIILSIEKEDTRQVPLGYTFNSTMQSQLSRQCWNKIDKVLVMGVKNLEEKHSKVFHEQMNRISLHIIPKDQYNEYGRLKEESRTSVEAQVEASFSYGRYLMLSAASGAVTNLQGVWADGRKCAWSGDYHFNINMQMQYWPADSARISEILPPYFSFIKKLAKAGEGTARHMYGCNGWVTHAYTDGYFMTGVLGAYIWAFCVTCGAWLALSLWDHLTYQLDLSLLLNDLLPAFRGIAAFFLEYMWVDGKGRYHTGPTTSPETSYLLDDKDDYQLAMSPAIDVSILRQVANAYYLAVTAAQKLLTSNAMQKTKRSSSTPQAAGGYDLEADFTLATRFRAAVQKMPYQALPAVGKSTGIILEYPSPFPGASVDSEEGWMKKNKRIFENSDFGHRHFSALHWFYPGLFLPDLPAAGAGGGGKAVGMGSLNSSAAGGRSISDSKYVTSIYAAAKHLLLRKSQGGSGHTAWSASWKACLAARFGDSEMAWKALTKILEQYSTSNLLFLHPPLKARKEWIPTHFGDAGFNRDRKRACVSRGLKSMDKAPFQLDGNLGFVAAFIEMLLQSHVPGHLILLPALPTSLAASGSVSGLGARGDAIVSLSWKSNQIQTTSIIFHSNHPWFAPLAGGRGGGMVEESPGYFQWADGWSESTVSRVVVVYGNAASLRLFYTSKLTLNLNIANKKKNRNKIKKNNKSELDQECARVIGEAMPSLVSDPLGNRVGIEIEVFLFPCLVVLCNTQLNDDSCQERLTF